MFPKLSLKTLFKNGLLIGIGMILSLVLMNWLPLVSQTARADTQAAPLMWEQNNPEDANAETWISCTPIGVATYYNRVHVRCAAAVGGISYFAAPTNNPANAARILSTLSTAQVAGRTLSILYDPNDLSGTDFGCLEADCRPIVAVGFGQ
ncbi:MAG: hypothetical protein KDE51_12150 [Anaerolineales bacterium]|nr:hypothetical protein [Anaerolineales bacterium]